MASYSNQPTAASGSIGNTASHRRARGVGAWRAAVGWLRHPCGRRATTCWSYQGLYRRAAFSPFFTRRRRLATGRPYHPKTRLMPGKQTRSRSRAQIKIYQHHDVRDISIRIAIPRCRRFGCMCSADGEAGRHNKDISDLDRYADLRYWREICPARPLPLFPPPKQYFTAPKKTKFAS